MTLTTSKVSTGRVNDLSDSEYHKQLPLDAHSYSSSQIKQASKNLKLFHQEVVQGEKKETSPQLQNAFEVGHYFHSYFLEPETLEDKYVIYDGYKRGKAWADFQAAHTGKTIMTTTMTKTTDTLIQGVKENPIAMELLNNIELKSEVSFFTELQDLKVKCRFDILIEKTGGPVIAGDLKSCSDADLDNPDTLRSIITKYGYATSAALYMDVYAQCMGQRVYDFFWIFSSKNFPFSKVVYMTEEYYKIGQYQYLKGIEKIKSLRKDNWNYVPSSIKLKPHLYEMNKYREN